MEIYTFIVLLLALNYIAFGAFTYYLDWGRTPKRLLRLIIQTKKNTREIPYYMIGEFISKLIIWPLDLTSVWKSRWKILLRRVEIIIFIWLSFFVTASLINVYLFFYHYDLLGAILLEYILWLSSGSLMCLVTSMATKNKDEKFFSFDAIVYSLLLLLPGPFGFRFIHEKLKENIQSRTLRPN